MLCIMQLLRCQIVAKKKGVVGEQLQNKEDNTYAAVLQHYLLLLSVSLAYRRCLTI